MINFLNIVFILIYSVLLGVFCALMTAIFSACKGEEVQHCEQRRTILKYVSSENAEKPFEMGAAANGGKIEVLTSCI